ncbi:uncharacterized protein LOC123313241 [Coccinella septempunctata]|uniref:uncharacterized protein LOC123313241 n=1 Tax=Coccinella septempunctata TaxID=41139 RepID=UPI001D0764B2|nr:uncharacterized protein LOC123313241 [Coccinella septempunctata]
MASLTSEIKKRGSIKARLTNFTKFLKTVSDKLTFSDFELIQIAERLDAVQIVKSEFDELQNEIENSIEDDLLQAQYEERENFESNYFHQVSIAKKILKDNEKHEAPQSGVFPSQMLNGNLIQGNNVRLPTINLPKFDGSYQNWLEFRDTFRSLIHENASIGEIQKFHYLRASLEAEAALIIKSLEISSQNYTLAWNALKERYDNNKLLIYNHVKSLFSYESVQRESAHSLRNLIDVFSKNLRALAQLNQPVSQWDTLLVYLITTKLDVTTLREWEIYKGDLDVPNFDDFRAFVKNRADMFEMVAHNQADKRKAFNSGRNSQTRGLLSTDSGTNSVSCVICNDGHFIQNCKTFLALAPIDREKKIHSLKLCTNCLKKGHFNKDCRRGNCRKCGSKHNTLLRKGTENIGNSSNDKEKSAAAKTTEDKPTINLSACSSISQVILSTAFVQVDDNERHTHIVRALLDSGAQSSFITTKLCKNLKFRTEPVNISVLGLNNLSSNISSKCVLRFESIHNDFSIQKCFFVINEIAGDIPSEPIDVSNFKVPEQISLADPNYHTPEE